ncbi:MAG: ComEA family DNA-binding protein [Candidatus Berkelbacteria bacterium]
MDKIKLKKTEYEKFIEKTKEFVDKYRLYIGGGLLIFVIVLSGGLLWLENRGEPEWQAEYKELSARLSALESKTADKSLGSPSVSSEQSIAVASASSESQSSSTSKTAAIIAPKGKVNINTANAAQLDTLPGIGAAYAGRIIDYRVAKGGFKTLEELKNVKGIGDATFNKLKDFITL